MNQLIANELDSIRNQSISSAIAKQLERLILSGEIRPGERINESKLAAELKVSRAPIREACRQLEKFGMVEVKVGRGTFVRAIKLEEALELYEIRTSLEVLACELACKNCSASNFNRIGQLISKMEKVAIDNDVQSYMDFNLEFHREIFRMSRNKSLLNLLETITKNLTLFRADVLRRPGEMMVSLEEHKTIYDLLKSGSSDEVVKVIKKHVTKGKKALMDGQYN